MSDLNVNANISIDGLADVRKKYKKIKRYMKSNLFQIKTMDGTEKIVSGCYKTTRIKFNLAIYCIWCYNASIVHPGNWTQVSRGTERSSHVGPNTSVHYIKLPVN